MEPLELRQELGDDFALPAHRPETHDVGVMAAGGAAAKEDEGKEQRDGAACRRTGGRYCTEAVSQPPSKPAFINPCRI